MIDPELTAVLDRHALGLGQLAPDRHQQRLEAGACRHGVAEVDDGHRLDEGGQLRIDHRPLLSGRVYFGCIRMPASSRIDSAFMYELLKSSTASVANSLEFPKRCGNRTSCASLLLNASEPSPAP